MKYVVYLLLGLLLTGCGQSGNRKQATAGSDTAPQKREIIAVPSDSGTVKMNLTDGNGKLSVRKEPRQTVTLEFESGDYKKLEAQIVPEKPGNLRISQIVLPDGTMDGPFGQSIRYDIPSPGTVRLLIGESLMQGDPWSGEFTVSVTLR